MGLVEIVMVGLCLNSTCIEDQDNFRYPTIRQKQFEELQKQIQYENFIVATMNNEKLSGFEIINGTKRGTGTAFDILNIIQQKFKFNYTVVSPTSNTWGSSRNGVLRMLRDKKANLSAAFLPFLAEYALSSDITYSTSLDTGDWVVMMKRPRESATGSGLLAPFTLPVWILIVISVIVVGPVIHFIIYIQVRICKEENDIVYPLSACCWFVYGALLKQGSTLNPITDSSRLLFATWWLFITILTAFYTANLTAFLTLSKFTLPIKQPKDIGNRGYRWVTTIGNALEDTLVLNDEAAAELQHLIGSPRLYIDKRDNYILEEFVNKENMMFIREKPIVEHVMYDNYKQKVKEGIEEAKRCTFVFTDFSVTSYARAFAYTKDFKYKLLFDSTIQYLVQSGIIQFKLTEELPDTRICPMDLKSKERQLRNTDLLLTYLIIGGGFLVSIIVFFLEVIIRRCCYKGESNATMDLFFKNPKFNNNNNGVNFKFVKEISHGANGKFITPPPPYHSLFQSPFGGKNGDFKVKHINGRDYWVSNGQTGGSTTLIPLRTPSALLFQYTN